MNKVLFTASGYKKIQKELKSLKEKRPTILNSLVRAREMGDLSENGAYKSAKSELKQIDRNIEHLEFLVRSGQIVRPSNNEHVQIGHTVTLRKLSNS